MPKKKGEASSKKEIILENAKNIFSQKGYDAATMDEIALNTGVPKSLIYYHYKNKEELLQAIIDKFFIQYESLLNEKNQSERYKLKKYFDFLDSNSAFLRVILIESLKKNNTAAFVFKVVNLLMHQESKCTGNKDIDDYAKSHARWVAEFFTSIIPSALFMCYKDEWCTFFETDIETLKHDFFSAYEMTHGEYHKNLEELE